MSMSLRTSALVCVTALSATVVAACGGSSSTSSSSASSGAASATTTAPASTAAVPSVDATAFTADFAVMKQLTGVAAQGKGLIGVLLPDTTTSARYVTYDAPYLTQAFKAAGLTDAQFKIDNAHGSASTMQQQAEADITSGATVLLVDPLDVGSGAANEPNGSRSRNEPSWIRGSTSSSARSTGWTMRPSPVMMPVNMSALSQPFNQPLRQPLVQPSAGR